MTHETHSSKQHHSFQLGDSNLTFNKLDVIESAPTTRHILEAGGYQPVADYLLFQITPEGGLIELNLDQAVNLRPEGEEKFIYFKNDRSFRFMVNEVRIEWGAPTITGRVVKAILHDGPDDYDLVLVREGEAEKVIGDHDVIDLNAPGVEKLHTRKRQHLVEVKIDKRDVKIKPGVYVVSVLKDLLGVPADKELDEILSGAIVALADDAKVDIKGGECFVSHSRRGGSS